MLPMLNSTEIASPDLIGPLHAFQLNYKLNLTNELTEEDLSFMRQGRCGVTDTIQMLNKKDNIWSRKNLKWYVHVSSHDIIAVTKEAFLRWEKYVDLHFTETRDPNEADISISFGYNNHNYLLQRTSCKYPLMGSVLAHAFFPQRDNPREIHVSLDTDWSYNFDPLECDDCTELLPVMIHEIGHTLGLQHTGNVHSIMYPYYFQSTTLHDDDIRAIQNLYGKPKTNETQQNMDVTSSTKIPTVSIPRRQDTKSTLNVVPRREQYKKEPLPELCKMQNVNTFFIFEGNLYVIYEKWYWTVDMETGRFAEPKLISKRFPFLPTDFKKVKAIIQDPQGYVVAAVDDQVYVLNGNDLTELKHFSIDRIINGARILNGVVNTYTGRTYIFHDDVMVTEVHFDDGLPNFYLRKTFGKKFMDVFPEIPKPIDSVFRFTDGLLYFFKENSVFKYNEFTKKLIEATPNTLELFGVSCPNVGLLEQLRNILRKLESTLS